MRVRRAHRRRRRRNAPLGGAFTFALFASGLIVALFLLKKASAPALPAP